MNDRGTLWIVPDEKQIIQPLFKKKVGEGINRILTLGNKIKMKQVRDVFKFPGTIIFQLLYSSPLLKYDDQTVHSKSNLSLHSL